MKGKNAKGEETVEIEIDRLSTYRTRYTKAKTVESASKETTKAGDMEKFQRRLLTGMETHSSAVSDLEISQIAQQMAATGHASASSLDGANMAIGDIKKLAPRALATPVGDEQSPSGPGEIEDLALSACHTMFLVLAGCVF